MDDSNPELESFRQQWRAEVSARSKADDSRSYPKSQPSSKPLQKPPASSKAATELLTDVTEEGTADDDLLVSQPSVGYTSRPSVDADDVEGFENNTGSLEPRSALEHYEKAVERESQGSLGDSLNLYRKAFRMDSQVDLKYKNKHFPPSKFPSKSINSNPLHAVPTIPDPTHPSLDAPLQTIKELISGFAGLAIKPALPEIEGTPPPPCPIIEVPHEILIHILTDVAIIDVASFVRLAQVCKHLAYLVATEEPIWKRVCLGSEVGFGAMHYQWQREITGELLEDTGDLDIVDDREDNNQLTTGSTKTDPLASTDQLLLGLYSSSWHKMFRLRPRLRFNGVYISTVNYIRPGQASPSQITWNSPIHIVTYFRYLRFFRDGTVISLLTTSEPTDVVHHLTKDLLELHQSSIPRAHLPSAVMQTALRGRWRLSGVDDDPNVSLKDSEGDVFVETEGVGGKDEGEGTKYTYRMELSLRSAGKAARNNKLVWKGFWCYNRLTDDWGEFGLRNDKAFFWSRVKSYGMGK